MDIETVKQTDKKETDMKLYIDKVYEEVVTTIVRMSLVLILGYLFARCLRASEEQWMAIVVVDSGTFIGKV